MWCVYLSYRCLSASFIPNTNNESHVHSVFMIDVVENDIQPCFGSDGIPVNPILMLHPNYYKTFNGEIQILLK